MYNPFQSFEEGEGRTKPLEDFKYLLPGPGPSELLNESLIDKFGRDDSKELERLEAIDKKAPIRQKRQLTAEAVGREVSKSKYARRFFKGMEGSALNSVAGIARMTGKDDFADNLQAYMQDPMSDKRMAKLLTMAEDTSDFQAERLKEELEENFGTQLAEGAGQLTGQIALTTSASAVGGPKTGMFALVGQVVGQNYEGNYQRAKQELIEKEFTNKLPETDEEMQAVMDKASDDAKEIAFKNLPSAVPEVILDRLFLKGLGKTLKNQAGTVTDKLVGTTVGALSEGGSEALSASLQNFMVKRNIDPDQPLTEGVLRDFALGSLLGGGANLATGAVGAGEQVLSSDIQGFRNELIKRLKKDAKAGDQRAQDFLDRLSNMMETQVADGDIIASASTQGTGNGMSAKEVQSIVDEVSGKSGVNTIVVNNLDEVKNIDPSLAPSLEGQEGVEGFYTSAGGDQRVFLNASELNSREDVERVLRHESVGHLGTEMVSGQMSDEFYTMIGEKYFDSDLGKKIANDYALDPLFDLNTLGKEIVARVSENPDNASPGFKGTIIDTFHKLTGGRIEQNPETDRLITKSITLAEQVLASPKIRTKLEAQAKDVRVEDEDDIDTVMFSRRSDPEVSVKLLQNYQKEVEQDYLDYFDYDSSVAEVTEALENDERTEGLTPQMGNLLKALQRDDFLGFDKPLEALDTILTEDTESLFKNYEISPDLKQSITNYMAPEPLAPEVVQQVNQANREILFRKKEQELRGGMTRDKNGNIFYKGQPPNEWGPETFDEVGKLYGIKRFGGLSPLKEIKDPESGKTYKIPGGLDGKFTYYDLLWLKSNQPGIQNIGEATHAKITKKLTQSLTPEKVDKVDHFNRLAFGFLSPNAPLLPNEYGVARLFASSEADIAKLAKLAESLPANPRKRGAWNKKVKAQFDIGSRADGQLGIGLTQDFGRLANFARLYQKNPDFFVKKADEEWSDFVDKVASQVSGFGTKTASFGGVWQDPFNAMISAIDRHMATKFADKVIGDPALKKRFQKLMVGKFNKEIDKSREARAKYQAKLKKAKTEKTKLKLKQDWEDNQENILDPSIRKVKTLDGVMRQAERVGIEQISKALGKATLAGMSARNPQFRNAKGEINPNLEGEIALTKFIEEPEKVKIMSEAYRKALDINEKKAEELGIPVFPAQWTLWDRIRGRIEPHEVMFPGLFKLPRMGREQIAQTYNTHIASGYGIAPLEIKPTNLPPERLVYFSKKPGSTPNPITGESKFIVRLKADETLPSQIRDKLDSLYTVEAHQDVLDSLKPWFEAMEDKDYIEISRAIQSNARNDLNPTQKMLAGQIMLKRLSAKANSLRKKMDKKDSTGQMKFAGIVDTNKFDDEAIDLGVWMSEQGRAMGRAISILQVFGELNPNAMFKLAKSQLDKATDQKLRKKLGEGGDRIVSELERIVKVAQQAGYDQIGIEFLKEKAPSLIKAIEKQFAPSLWGAYRKDAVGKLHKQIMQAMAPTSESADSAPLARFTNELVSELAKRMNLESGTGQRKLRAKSDILRDALLNPEKYQQVWRDLALKLKQDNTLSDEQKAKIEDLFGTIPTDPSGKILDSTMQERMKRFGVQIQELVRQSADTKRTTGKKLVDSIVDEMGLPPKLATKLAIQLQSTYQKRIREVANSQLETFKKQQLGEKASRKIKGLEQTIVELANLGALTRQDLTEAVAKKLGIKGTFDRKFANELQRLALQIEETPEGFQRINKVQDVLNLIQNQAGDDWPALLLAIRTAGLVSGVSTQVVNLTGNTATAVPMFMTQVMRSGFSPQTAYLMARNMLFGLVKGSQEAKSIMLTGRGRTGYEMEKYSFDPILERKTLPGGKLNPYNYLKYVHRFMSSMDAMFRFTNIEGKATFLLAMEGKKKGYRGKRLRQYIDEGLGNTEALREGAEAQATLEGLSGLDHRRRTNEILESNRNPEIKEESEQYGLRSTYQNRPEGILGAVALKFAQASYPQQLPGQQIPLSQQAVAVASQFFVPFIRVVANVQNMAFDYTPVVGAGRALWHKYGGAQVKTGGKNITEEQYQDLMARQLIGLAMAGSLGALFFNEEEDENNRMFDVTGAGPRNYQKRKTLAESGWKPYTVTWMGKQLGYKETPFGGFLAFMGGIKDMQKYEDDQYTMGNIISAGTVAYGRLMFDQAFFKGIGDLIDVLSFDEQSGARFTRLLLSSPGQVAVPNLFNQIEAMLTNEKYTKGEGESALLHEILPFSPARALGLPNRDVFGQRVQRYNEEFPMNLVARVYDSDRKDPLLQELIAKKIIPVSPNRSVSIRGEELDDALSDLHRDQDIYVYSEIKGRHLKNKLQELFKKDRDGQTGLERFRALSREDAQKFYNKVNTHASDIAKRETSRMTRLEIVERIKKLKAE